MNIVPIIIGFFAVIIIAKLTEYLLERWLPEKPSWRHIVTVTITILVLLPFALLYMSVVTSRGNPEAKITSHSDKVELPLYVNFEGTYDDLPQDSELWLYVYDPESQLYNFSFITTFASDKTWDSRGVEIGQVNDEGKPFEIGVLIADVQVWTEIRTQLKEASALPNGARKLDKINVFREATDKQVTQIQQATATVQTDTTIPETSVVTTPAPTPTSFSTPTPTSPPVIINTPTTTATATKIPNQVPHPVESQSVPEFWENRVVLSAGELIVGTADRFQNAQGLPPCTAFLIQGPITLDLNLWYGGWDKWIDVGEDDDVFVEDLLQEKIAYLEQVHGDCPNRGPTSIIRLPVGGPFREHVSSSIGTAALANVTCSDGLAPYPADVGAFELYNPHLIQVVTDPSGCGTAKFAVDKVWFASRAGPIVTINSVPVAEVELSTLNHGFIVNWSLNPGDTICLDPVPEEGYQFIFGPAMYYLYDSYCSNVPECFETPLCNP